MWAGVVKEYFERVAGSELSHESLSPKHFLLPYWGPGPSPPGIWSPGEDHCSLDDFVRALMSSALLGRPMPQLLPDVSPVLEPRGQEPTAAAD